MTREFDELIRAIRHWARVVSLAPEYDEYRGYNGDAIAGQAAKLIAAFYDAGQPANPTGEVLPDEALAHYILKLLIRFELHIKLTGSHRHTHLTITEGLARPFCIRIPQVALPVLAVRYVLMISADPSAKPVFHGQVNIRWKGIDNKVRVSVQSVDSRTVILLCKQ